MGNFLVVGLGAFGKAVAESLYAQKHTVVGVDVQRERVEHFRDLMSECVEADASDREMLGQVLDGIGVENLEAAVVGVGRRLDVSVLVCLFLKEAGVKRIVAKVLTEDHARALRHLGVNETVFPEADSGMRLAKRLSSPRVLESLSLGQGYQVMEIEAPAAYADKNLQELAIREKSGALVVAIRRAGSEKLETAPNGESRVGLGDALILLGPEDAPSKLEA
ncbi:MAG: TrkA family potassium uptake protein [bacterium]|nr:TrkA family potassium uptake protein [bacterium]